LNTYVIIGLNILAFSLILNVYLFFKLIAFRKKKVESYDARQLLHDLTKGTAVVSVTRLDPENLMVRSPR
jgi:hypothetical protein